MIRREAEEPAQGGTPRRALWVAALAAPWAMVIRRLCYIWATDPQYAYGWSVPCLAAVLFALRWSGQPRREPMRCGGVMILVAALLLPMRIVQEAAPDWSTANWTLALGATAVTFVFLLRTGGWRWARWFLFPVLFLLTTAPWPQRFDLWLTQGLMRKDAAATVEILGWFGAPAFCEGNLIRLPAGSIGIDEACSGIRSLQAMLMVSLFLGELRRLDWARRVAVAGVGLGLAFVGNVIRTTALSGIAAHYGMTAFRSWHDPAGLSILCFGLAGTWIFAGFPRRGSGGEGHGRAPIPALRAVAPMGIILWICCVEGAVEIWYRAHETGAPAERLTFVFPRMEKGFHAIEIPDETRRVLLFTTGDAAEWTDDAGREWWAYHLVWAPGRTSTQSARVHRPETCLEASGAILMREYGEEEVPISRGALRFGEYLFQKDGAPLYVMFTLYEEQPADRNSAGMLQDWGAWSRVQRALAGERNLGQESVEIAMAPGGEREEADAFTVMKGRVEEMVGR
jgi:exosortase